MNAPSRPSLAQTSRLVARALGMTPQALAAGFRPAIWADLPQLLALRAPMLGEARAMTDRAYLTWRYRLGRGEQGGGDCWVLFRQGELLGMVGTQEIVLHCDGQSCKAWSLMDIMIQPTLAGAGLGVWLNLAIQDQAEATLAIGANANSIGMVRRLFDMLPNRRTWVHPVSLGHFVKQRLPIPGVSTVLAALAEHAIRYARMALLSPWAFKGQVRPLDLSEEALISLSARVTSSAVVHCERTPQQLHWRARANPRGGSVFWGAWTDGQLIAAIGTQSVALDGGRRALIVMDAMVAVDERNRAWRALLWAVLEQAWYEKADYVAITILQEGLEKTLKSAGFRQQGHEFETLGWTCKNEAFRASVAARPDWTLSELHTDRF